MPVYQKHRDNVAGVLHARDLLGMDLGKLGEDQQTLKSILRKPFFVPESKSTADLFDTFRERNKSLALVVDEYGGVIGVVTMSDLLECIFGDIPIEPVETEMIRRMFSFSERRGRDAVRPLIEVTAIEREATCGEAQRLATGGSGSRSVRLPLKQLIHVIVTFSDRRHDDWWDGVLGFACAMIGATLPKSNYQRSRTV